MRLIHEVIALVSAGVIFSSSRAAIVTDCTEQSLRSALAGGGTVTFGCDGGIILSNTISISTNTVLDGFGREVKLSGGARVRLFDVSSGTEFTLKNLTIADGAKIGANASYSFETHVMTQPENAAGGAIYATNATISIDSCIFTNNAAKGGNPYLNPIMSLVSNMAASEGGALSIQGGRLTIRDSQFLQNHATPPYGTDATFSYDAVGFAKGGAIAATHCEISISSSQFLGNTAGTPGGGAIDAENCLFQMISATFENNTAAGNFASRSTGTPIGDGRGGSLRLIGSAANITNSIFMGNLASGGESYHGDVAAGEGGAIYTDSSIQIQGSLFLANGVGANASGGGIYSSNTATLTSCRFLGNSAIGSTIGADPAGNGDAGSAFGGALYANGLLSLSNSSFVSNSISAGLLLSAAPGPGGVTARETAQGGAVYAAGQVLATNITVALNQATNWDANLVAGAGFYLLSPSNQFSYSTLASNLISVQSTVGQFGEEIATGTKGVVSLHATILSGLASNLVQGSLIDLGFNLSSDNSLTHPSSRNHVDAKLLPIGLYDAVIETMALMKESPAIDGGDTNQFPVVDARGKPRSASSAPDIGAFEYQVVGSKISLNITALAGGRFRITGFDNAGRESILEGTMSFQNWEPIATYAPSQQFEYESQADQKLQIFRVRVPQ